MKALKDEENTLGILQVNTNAIITYQEQPIIPLPFHPDMNTRGSLSPEFDGVADQILEKLHQLRSIPHHCR